MRFPCIAWGPAVTLCSRWWALPVKTTSMRRILWKSKRTKAWNDVAHQTAGRPARTAKAEIALIASTVLPKGVETFDLIDGIWVTKQRFAIPLAIALRQSLIDLASSNRAAEGQRTKWKWSTSI
jgi:hypothetical protein